MRNHASQAFQSKLTYQVRHADGVDFVVSNKAVFTSPTLTGIKLDVAGEHKTTS